MSQNKIGQDEWVASYGQRLGARSGIIGRIQATATRIPVWGWMVILFAIGFVVPLLTSSSYVIHVAGTIALFAALAIGLNVVVGYAGLLDLGFVAFYGVGAYAYAYLSSPFTGLHLPTWIVLPIITILAALFGLLLGSPSLRLIGDYLAIVTLGFGQIFVQLMTTLTRVSIPGLADPVNLTGGPNGIINIDPVNFLGFVAHNNTDYYYILLVLLMVVLIVVYRMNHSRLGRAWRALREDELAAGLMGMPTRQLKLLAFATGAAIAGLCGGIYVAWQGSVFPNNFDVNLLITIYGIIVLGGLGSLPGVVIGAAIMIAMPEILRNPALAGALFYIGVVIVLWATMRPRWHAFALIGAVAVFGFALRILLGSLLPATLPSIPQAGSAFSNAIRSWLAIPTNFTVIGNWAFAGMVLLIMLVTRLHNKQWRFVGLIPTLYLLAFTWETRLSQEPSVTRLIFVGVLLVVLMIYRPFGLLGQRRVEVV